MKLEIDGHWFAIWWGSEIWTAIAIARWERPVPFAVEKYQGEYTIDWRSWRIIFTPPGWKPIPLLSPKEYDPA